MRLRNFTVALAASAGLQLGGSHAYAQRAGENVVTAAEDAFGTKVGQDSIGLYDQRNARGFDPQAAGNLRIEGLYYDQQAVLGSRVQKSLAMRVGIAAQSFPFPAPTGIADIILRQPGNKSAFAFSSQYQGPGGLSFISVDYETPIVKDKLSVLVGAGVFDVRAETGRSSLNTNWATIVKWQPNDRIDVLPFHYRNLAHGAEVQPSVFTGGGLFAATDRWHSILRPRVGCT